MELVEEKAISSDGVVLVTKDAEGEVQVQETGDHLGRKGPRCGGGVGLVVGPLRARRSSRRPPSAPPSGRWPGSSRKHRVEAGIGDKLDDALPPGSAGIIAIYEHDDADAVAEALAELRSARSTAQIDKASAKELKAGLEEASARARGLKTMSSEPKDRGFVVVTGTSTGIGAATALHLADKGFHVFAGVRRAERRRGACERKPRTRLTPLIIDVTDEATISAAAAAVADAVGDRGLAGLVNNAGIAKPAPIEFQPMADFRTQLEVNLFGPVAMIQAFLPLIRRGGGRIVNVGSIGGLLVLPLNGAYSASKFGIRAITDALRLELRQWNIHVSLIEVAPVKTAIFGKTYAELDGLEKRLGEAGYRLYEEQIAAVRKATEKAAADADPPLVIAEGDCPMRSRRTSPKTRYLAGHGGKEVAIAAALPDRARDRALVRELGLPKPE